MTEPVTHAGGGGAAATLAAREAQLRVLHELRGEARLVDGFEAPYVSFVRALRERLHPRGVRDIRTVQLDGALTVSIDVGDRLGCDIYYGYYEEAFDARLFVGALRPGSTVVDVGANFGYYTLLAARAIGPAGIVHAFEPDPDARALLEINIAANGLTDRVTIHPVALGLHDGTVELQLAEESAFSSVRATGRSKSRGVLRVPLRSLDSLADACTLRSLDALKIDAEGSEDAILRGSVDLIRSSPDPLIMLEICPKNFTAHTEAELADVVDALYRDGFHALAPDLEQADGLRIVPRAEEVARLINTNVFLVRAHGAAEARLRQAAARQIGRPSAVIDTRPVDADERPLALYTGVDPALVTRALRAQADVQAQADAAVAAVGGLRAENDALQAQLEQLRAENAKLTAMVEDLAATRAELRTAAEACASVVERQSAEVAELRAAVERGRGIIQRQDAEIAALADEVAARRAELEAAWAQSRAAIERQSGEVAELRAALQRGQAVIDRQAATIAGLQRQASFGHEQIEAWRAMTTRQDAEIAELRAAVEQAHARSAERSALAERLARECQEWRARLEQARARIADQRTLIERLSMELAAPGPARDTVRE